jgi:hypothetical protein
MGTWMDTDLDWFIRHGSTRINADCFGHRGHGGKAKVKSQKVKGG